MKEGDLWIRSKITAGTESAAHPCRTALYTAPPAAGSRSRSTGAAAVQTEPEPCIKYSRATDPVHGLLCATESCSAATPPKQRPPPRLSSLPAGGLRNHTTCSFLRFLKSGKLSITANCPSKGRKATTMRTNTLRRSIPGNSASCAFLTSSPAWTPPFSACSLSTF